jgi:A/G-specific adenine glycosylase
MKLFSPSEVRRVQKALLAWFKSAQRPLPWRTQRNPYSVWVSEVMLQQTQVNTVIPYFERWMRTYPSVAALASAREQDVLKLWEGLGYYSRARSLLKGAQMIAEHCGGLLPADADSLRTIPGIGRYTAGAIASIGYQQPEPILDGNVMRVLCRLCDLAGDPRKAPLNEHLWTLARQLVTNTHPSQLNESLMELGATVCTPSKPKCSDCPLRRVCRSLANNHVDQRPSPTQRTTPTARKVLVTVVFLGNHVLVQQQGTRAAHWAGLWTFPFTECRSLENPEALATRQLTDNLHLPASNLSILSQGKYTITRFRFSYVAVQALVPRATRVPTPDGYTWVTRRKLLELPMPAPHRRLAHSLPSATPATNCPR